jgi:polar amino acid transport system permease protein
MAAQFTRRQPVFRWDIFWHFLFSGFFLQAAWTTLWISVVAHPRFMITAKFPSICG